MPSNRSRKVSSKPLITAITTLSVITPIITLWNPYSVALEIEGAIAYPWMDMPFSLDWKFKSGSTEKTESAAMSQILGSQFISQGHGRTVNPYFFSSITPNGTATRDQKFDG